MAVFIYVTHISEVMKNNPLLPIAFFTSTV